MKKIILILVVSFFLYWACKGKARVEDQSVDPPSPTLSGLVEEDLTLGFDTRLTGPITIAPGKTVIFAGVGTLLIHEPIVVYGTLIIEKRGEWENEKIKVSLSLVEDAQNKIPQIDVQPGGAFLVKEIDLIAFDSLALVCRKDSLCTFKNSKVHGWGAYDMTSTFISWGTLNFQKVKFKGMLDIYGGDFRMSDSTISSNRLYLRAFGRDENHQPQDIPLTVKIQNSMFSTIQFNDETDGIWFEGDEFHLENSTIWETQTLFPHLNTKRLYMRFNRFSKCTRRGRMGKRKLKKIKGNCWECNKTYLNPPKVGC